MKIIYEDGNDRSNKDATPPDASNGAMPQLTNEQIAALLQMLANQQTQTSAPQPQPSESPAPPAQDPGTRILFQSDDFDAQEQTAKRPSISVDPGMRIAYSAEPEKPVHDKTEVQRRTDGNFSINEFTLEAPTPMPLTVGDIAVDEVDEEAEAQDTRNAKRLSAAAQPAEAPQPARPSLPTPAPPQPASFDHVPQENRSNPIRHVPAPVKPTPTVWMQAAAKPAPEAVSEPEAPNEAAPQEPPAPTGNDRPEPLQEAAPSNVLITTDDADANVAAPKHKTGWTLRKTILLVSVLAILISSGVLVWEFKLHKDNQKLEDEVSNLIVTGKAVETPPGGNIGNSVVLTDEQQWEQIKAEFPNVVFPKNLQLKYARLYATNTDFVGYLEVPGINMSLPVVQTSNDEDYLNKNFYGKSTKYGCPFVSCINNVSDLDFNTVIYGHHMNDRTIFGALDAYKSIDGFRKAPVIMFNTLYTDYQWKIVAAFLTNSVADDDNGYVFNYYFNRLSSDEKKAEYLRELASRSFYNTGVDVLPSDRLLTLSTCAHEFDDARLVVVARLVRPGESAEVDTSLATLNPNPRYPQVYYTKKKQTNPYTGAARWTVG